MKQRAIAVLLLGIGISAMLLGCGKEQPVQIEGSPMSVTATQTDTEAPMRPRKKLTPSSPKAFEKSEALAVGTLPAGIGVPVGKQLPDFKAMDAAGSAVRLSKLVAKGKILLVFYRGGW
ncbi:MAG: hypothetical protein QNJ97_00575 [Myxococcota bacterium]|nr:hypothetical protein [Myxococcota bacterium]